MRAVGPGLLSLVLLACCATGPRVHDLRIPEAGGLVTLPLVESPASHDSGDLMAVVLTGDGGWRHIDVRLAKWLNAAGLPVLGWSASYFHQRRTPDETAGDLAAILEHFGARWKKKEFVLVGYSRGADILPFAVSRLPRDLQDRVRVLALLGPSAGVDFHLSRFPWLHAGEENDYQVLPEIVKLKGLPMVCVMGAAERASLCPVIPSGITEVVTVPGGHHFAGDYALVARLILQAAGHPSASRP